MTKTTDTTDGESLEAKVDSMVMNIATAKSSKGFKFHFKKLMNLITSERKKGIDEFVEKIRKYNGLLMGDGRVLDCKNALEKLIDQAQKELEDEAK